GNSAQLMDGNVSIGRLRALRQQDRHAIALPDTAFTQQVGKPIGALAQPRVTVFASFAVCADVYQRQAAGLLLRPFVADIHAHVVAFWYPPRKLAVQLVIGCGVDEHAATPGSPEAGVILRRTPATRLS